MIDISQSAQSHFRKLIEREAVPGMGVRLAANQWLEKARRALKPATPEVVQETSRWPVPSVR